MTVQFTRRGLLYVTAGVGAAGALAACSGTAAAPPAPGAASGSAGSAASAAAKKIDQAAYDAIILAGPVADDAAVSASAWAKKIKAAGVLKRGGTDTGPIFSLKDPMTGRIAGFDAGIADLLAHYITGGKDVSKLVALSQTTVDTRETMLQNNTVDVVVATYTITPKRAEKIAFAGPYYSSGASVQVKASDTTIKSYKDLAGKKVVTETNSTALTAIKDNIPNAEVITFTENDACVAAVEDGRAVAYVLDESILLSNALKNPKVKVVGQPFTVDPYGVGVNKDDAAAKAFVNGFLQKIFDSGDWAKLFKATIGLYSDVPNPTPPKIGSVAGS